MYFDQDIVAQFAEKEQNEKNFLVAEIMDMVIMKTIGEMCTNFHAAELWWWAHPDRYDHFFDALMAWHGTIDRVDISPFMLHHAKQYISTDKLKNRLEVIHFVEKDIVTYLSECENGSLNLAIMKYTIDHIADLDILFSLLSQKLCAGWAIVSSIWGLSPELKSISTNARFLYNGEEFPLDETRTLRDGDTFMVRFFQESWKPESWYLPGWETTKRYHSKEKYQAMAQKYWFQIYIWDYKDLLPNTQHLIDQDVLVLRK